MKYRQDKKNSRFFNEYLSVIRNDKGVHMEDREPQEGKCDL